MKVAELISALQSLPKDADVKYLFEGSARLDVKIVWLTRSGEIILSDDGTFVWDDEFRPINAPSSSEAKYWRT